MSTERKSNWSIDVCREWQVTVVSCVFLLTLDLNRLVIESPSTSKGLQLHERTKKRLNLRLQKHFFLPKEEHLKHYGGPHISIPRDHLCDCIYPFSPFWFHKKSRHRHTNPKSELTPNRKTRSVFCLKCKKYPNGFLYGITNHIRIRLLITEPKRITRKNKKDPKTNPRKPIWMSKLICNINIWNINMYFEYWIFYLVSMISKKTFKF